MGRLIADPQRDWGWAMRLHQNIFKIIMTTALVACGQNTETETATNQAEALTWENYSIDPPEGEVLALLNDSPLLYPTRECRDIDDLIILIPAPEFA